MSSSSHALPCVVQVGFAGSRRLFDSSVVSEEQVPALHRQVGEQLMQKLGSLPNELGLAGHHFLCGISQIAIGADTIFTRACQCLNIPQRIFLPQPRDVYLAAAGSNGEPDFTAQERSDAEALLGSGHIIQERVVSDADDRASRFEDCNREMLRVSDVVICLLRADAEQKRGGTDDLLSLAQSHGKRVFEIRVELKNGEVKLISVPHGPEEFAAPTLPKSIQHLSIEAPSGQSGGAGTLPSVSQFCDAVKQHASAQAKRKNELFSRAALMIIGTHVFATLCATAALAGHGAHVPEPAGIHPIVWWIAGLLAAELALLLCGFGIHLWLHRAKPLEVWALSRLLAEINRSVKALGNLHIYPAYLFRLRLPNDLHYLLRTINILHLRSTRTHARESWDKMREMRDAYLFNRLTNPSSNPKEQGQISYYKDWRDKECRRLRRANAIFIACSSLAILSTFAKLILLLGVLPLSVEWETAFARVLGSMAIFLPTLAVGALSWAAAKEYKARGQTFKAMHEFLKAQETRFQQATSTREFHCLVEETEANLLGETAEWYSRRTVASVT